MGVQMGGRWGFGGAHGGVHGSLGMYMGCRWGFGGADGIRDADRVADGVLEVQMGVWGADGGFRGAVGGAP